MGHDGLYDVTERVSIKEALAVAIELELRSGCGSTFNFVVLQIFRPSASSFNVQTFNVQQLVTSVQCQRRKYYA
jgi:hypothetical protein